MGSMCNPRFFDLEGKRQETTWDEAFAAAARIKAFFDAMSDRFPGRQELCEKMMYAVMTRHHVLMIGPHGTAKTMLINAVFKSLVGARVWSIQMTPETTIDDIFGMLDIEALRNERKQQRLSDGTMATANFARIGELMDGNDRALRGTLLGAIHEREVNLGGSQCITLPLMSAFADTNFHIDDEPARVKQLAAVWDRFLFVVNVEYLEDPRDRMAMFMGAADNLYAEPVGELLMEDIVLVSGLVRSENLHANHYVFSAWEEATRFFRDDQKTRPGEVLVSDRRLVQGMDIMEAHALLNGRTQVGFLDVDEARLVLCGRPEHHKFFEERVPQVLKEWKDRAVNQAVESEREEIAEMVRAVPKVHIKQEQSAQVLSQHIKNVEALIEQLKDYKPVHIVINSELEDKISQMRSHLADTQLRLIEVVKTTIPTEQDIEGKPLDQLAIMFQNLGVAASFIFSLNSVDTDVERERLLTREAMEMARARIQTETGFNRDFRTHKDD